MGVIFSEHDARRLQKCLHAFERGGFGGKAEKRRHFNYEDKLPAYARSNSADQSVTSSTDNLVKFQDGIHDLHEGTSAFTWSTTAHTIKFNSTGLWKLSGMVPYVTPGAGSGEQLWWEEDSTLIPASKFLRQSPPTGAIDSIQADIEHVVTSSTKVYRLIFWTDVSGVTILGSSSQKARLESRKLR